MNLSSYLPVLVDLMLKSVILLGVALLAAWAGRRVSAANRHLIWLAVFGQLLALPFATAWVSSAEASRARFAGADTAIVLTLPAEVAQPPESMWARSATEPASPLRALMDWTRGKWRAGVVAAWLSVTVGLLAWRIVGAGRLRLLRRRSPWIRDARIEAWALRIAVEQGLRRRVELRASPECPVAMTWGTLRPVVMLPAEASAWSDERLEWVLRHELAHVARRDCLVRLLSQVACALYWPNPLVWVGARRLRLAQEQACDDRVLAAGAEARGYASELVAGARALAGGKRRGAALAMAETSTLEKRIVGIVDERRDRGAAHRSTMAFTLVVAAMALIGCTAVRVAENVPAATLPATVPAAPVAESRNPRQVEIEARFIEFKADTPEAKAAMAELEKLDAYELAPGELGEGLSLEASVALIRDLCKRVDSDLLSAPKITMLSGRLASITVAQAMRDPAVDGNRSGATETGAPGAGVTVTAGTPEDFAAANIGVEMKVLAQLDGDGIIDLQLEGKITEMHGFVETAPTSFQPIFSTRRRELDVRIKSGTTTIFRLPREGRIEPVLVDGRDVSAGFSKSSKTPEDRIVLVFVNAAEVPDSGPVAGGDAVAVKANP